MEFELNERLRSLVDYIAKNEEIYQYRIDTEAGSTKGDNYLGTITKVKVTDSDNKDKSLDLIMKTASDKSDFRKLVPIEAAFQREEYFYTNVISLYNSLLREYNLEELTCFAKLLSFNLEVPEVLMMSDMKAQGYIMKNRTEYLDLKHVELVMKEYGKLHGLFYALKVLYPVKAQKLHDNMHENFFGKIDFTTLSSRLVLSHTNEKVGKSLLPEDFKEREHFEQYTKNTMQKVLRILEPSAAGRFSVINHGDSWVNNMLFLYKGSVDPTHICFLDFQLARIGSPALDLSYFIFTCTDKKLRETHFNHMLNTYHASMEHLLEQFSLKVNDFLTIDELHQQMRVFSLFGVYMTLSITHLMLSEQEEIPDFQNMKIIDGDFKDSMKSFLYVSKNENRYMERVRGVILDAVERKYL